MIFPYVEPAYRLIIGRGLVPWEFELGAIMVATVMLTPLVALAQVLSSGPAGFRTILAGMMSTVSMLGVDAACRIGRCGHSILAGLFSALIAAVWAEIVYLSPHIAAEVSQRTLREQRFTDRAGEYVRPWRQPR